MGCCGCQMRYPCKVWHHVECLIIMGFIQVLLNEMLQSVANLELFRLLGGQWLPSVWRPSSVSPMVGRGVSSSIITCLGNQSRLSPKDNLSLLLLASVS